MEITSIRIKKNYKDVTILGVASVQFDNCLVIHDIKLVERDGKRMLSFPNKRTKRYVMENGDYTELNTYTDIVHPSNSEFRQYVEKEVFKVFDNDKGETNNE